MRVREWLAMVCSVSILSTPLAGQRMGQAGPPAPNQPAPTAVPAALDLQVRLDRAGFSPGEIDGAAGANTKRAQAALTKAGKTLAAEPAEVLIAHVITPEEVAGPFTESIPADMMEQSALPALNYASPLEQLAERFHSSPQLLQKLNPGAKFAAGESVMVPNITPRATDGELNAVTPGQKPTNGRAAEPQGRGSAPATSAAPSPNVTIVVSRSSSSLTVLDEKNTVIFHAPVTSGSQHDPLPLGKWAVTAVSRRPTFHYNPDLFWDADPAHAKAKIPPGPNNPVGLVWIDISREHYGIHGTPEPGKVGHTQSHGCVRLTNWDALYVASLVRKGTVVLFER